MPETEIIAEARIKKKPVIHEKSLCQGFSNTINVEADTVNIKEVTIQMIEFSLNN